MVKVDTKVKKAKKPSRAEADAQAFAKLNGVPLEVAREHAPIVADAKQIYEDAMKVARDAGIEHEGGLEEQRIAEHLEAAEEQ